MTTTIQIKDETHDLLKKLRSSLDAHSYDEVITKLASTHTRSLYGFCGKKSLKVALADLRDKHDRF